MTWFGRYPPNTITAWDYKFVLTDEHLTLEQMNPSKQTWDYLGEKALNRLNEISPPPPRISPKKSEGNEPFPDEEKQPAPDVKPKRDLYALLRDHAEEDEVLQNLWQQVNTVPEWVDWDQIARGQDVFYRYGGPVLTGLAYQSLLGGLGAARVTEVLSRTGGFAVDVARNRLFETTQYLLQCTRSLEGIQPGGEGWAATIRVRLLHATVRNRIMKLAETRPEYFDTAKLGIPINDMDCVGTIVSFSSALIHLSLPRQGIYLRPQEIEDYTALWRYIAHVIGCPTDGLLETKEQSKRILDSIMMYEISPTRTSQILANNVIRSLQDREPGYASADFLVAGARWLNGNQLCDALALPRPNKKKLVVLRDIFWKIVVKGGLKGEETSFDFKYVPEYSIMTEMGGDDKVKLSRSEIEIASLKWLLMGVAVVSVVGFVVTKMQRSYRCPCSVRALEVFVRDIAGLDIRQQRNFISFRNLSTRSTLQTRHSSTHSATSQAHAITRSLDDSFVPFESTATLGQSYTTQNAPSQSSLTTPSIDASNTPEPFDPDEELGSVEEFEPEITINEEHAQTEADPIVRDARIQHLDLKDRDQAIDAIFFPDLLAHTPPKVNDLQALGQRLNIFFPPTTAQNYPGKNARKKARKAAQAVEADPTPPKQPISKPKTSKKPAQTLELDAKAKAKADRKAKRAARTAEVQKAVLEQEAEDEETIDMASLIASATGPKPLSEAKAKKIALAIKARKAEEKAAKKAAMEKLVEQQAAAKEAQKERNRNKERWQVEKAVLQEKFGEQGWNPRKRISPDALAGIRALHAKSPETFSTPVLAGHFKIPPEAIRRILKSKWQPNEEEAEERRERWEKRGEKKWSEMAEQGIKPPKKWRERGVGKVGPGEVPPWKQPGKAGERWIESTDADKFVVAGDQVAEEDMDEFDDVDIASRIL
ncbi:hypothetical protein E4T47_06347 [Aureobasidium subglaciale]|nr:hypothetical protein E4T47_06347 [Aureobasidium subglaciale]